MSVSHLVKGRVYGTDHPTSPSTVWQEFVLMKSWSTHTSACGISTGGKERQRSYLDQLRFAQAHVCKRIDGQGE